MPLPLEDFYEDIIGKAQRGLGLSDADLIAQTGLSASQLLEAQAGTCDESVARKLAMVLNLGADALVACGKKSWHPDLDTLPEQLWQITTDYKGVMTVNAYVLAHPTTNQALIFDTGAEAKPILDLLAEKQLQAAGILITHGHGDHIAEIPKLKTTLGCPVYAVESGVDCDQPFAWGDNIEIAGFQIECRRTSGHAADGTTFVVHSQDLRIAITGDALFAGSMGGANDAWEEALENTRNQILTLPEDTLLCPGHGPLTTVGLEKQYNPFFSP